MPARLKMNDWAINQGLIGLYRILDNYTDLPIEMKQDGFILEEKHLKTLPQAYFSYFINEYSVATRERKKIGYFFSKWKNGDKTKKKDLNKAIKDYTEKKIEKYFADTFEGQNLIEVGQRLRDQEDYKKEADDWLDNYLSLMETKFINDKVTINYVKAVILGHYFGQPSFINVAMNKLTVQEQIEVFRRDYITPILEEWKFLKLVKNATSEKEVLDFLKKSAVSKPLSKLISVFRKKSLEKIREYLKTGINRCCFFDDQLGLNQLYEAHFSPLVLGEKNGKNFAWNGTKNSMPPISSLAKLVLFCSPAGATINNGRSLFVQKDDTFEGLLAVNNIYFAGLKKDKAFDEVVFDSLTKEQKKAQHALDNYLILEYTSDYRARKTLLNYMMLTPAVAKLLQNQSNLFRLLSYRSRWPILRSLLSYEDPKSIIFSVLRDCLELNTSSKEVIFGTIIRHLYQIYVKEEVKKMPMDEKSIKKEKSRIWSLYLDGAKIQYILGETKARGLAYRLLNATRSGDRNTFMDTALRVYISANEEIPALLLEVLHEEHLDFATVANAWIAGLVSKKDELRENGKKLEGVDQLAQD